MDLNCEKCSQRYHIPENKLEQKSVYFLCEKCGHKIIINRKTEGWFESTPAALPPYGVSSLIERVRDSFNLKSTLLSFLVLYSIFLFLGLAGFLVYKNPVFFIGHPVFSGIAAFLVIVCVSFVYDFLLYLISLNAYHRFEKNENIIFGSSAQDIAADAPKIFLFSSAGVLALFLMCLPIYAMRNGGPVYAAILFPLLFAAAALAVWPIMTREMLFSLIAFNRRNVKRTFKTIFRFIAVENLNIIAYSIIINIISAAAAAAAFMAAMLPALLAAAVSAVFLNTDGIGSIKNLISGVTSGEAAPAGGSSYFEAAAFVMLFYMSLAAAAVVSWLTVLRQTLFAASIKIMESNPGRSIPGGSMIIALLSAAAVVFIAGIFKAL